MTYNNIDDDFFNEFTKILSEESLNNPQTHFTEVAQDLAQAATELEQLGSTLSSNVDNVLTDIVNIISEE